MVSDNARPHIGLELSENGIEQMIWPARTSNINIIEKI